MCGVDWVVCVVVLQKKIELCKFLTFIWAIIFFLKIMLKKSSCAENGVSLQHETKGEQHPAITAKHTNTTNYGNNHQKCKRECEKSHLWH